MALDWPGAGWDAACSPTHSVGAVSTARTCLALSADGLAGRRFTPEGETHHRPLAIHAVVCYREGIHPPCLEWPRERGRARAGSLGSGPSVYPLPLPQRPLLPLQPWGVAAMGRQQNATPAEVKCSQPPPLRACSPGCAKWLLRLILAQVQTGSWGEALPATSKKDDNPFQIPRFVSVTVSFGGLQPTLSRALKT